MSYLLVHHHHDTSTDATGTVIGETSHGGPKFTLALLILLGLCAFIGVTWIFFKLFRFCKPHRQQHRTPSATVSGGLSVHSRDGSWRHRSLSGPFISDLERADTADSLTVVGRTDSMVTRASVWARAILSGEQPSQPSPPQPSSSSQQKNTKPWDTVSIPVKQAIVIMQPDGEASLGISEVKQKDVMVQVDEEDLLRTSSNSSGGGGRGGHSSSYVNIMASSSSTVVATRDEQRRQQRRDLIDEASQCPAQYSRERGRTQLVRVSSTTDAVAQETAANADELEIEASGSFSVVIPIEQQEDQQQQDRRRRRRRKRRKGTCEASCQTEE